MRLSPHNLLMEGTDMILTITLNPSVDMNYPLETFTLDRVNRVMDVSKTAGGKGLNVARVLQQLGEDVAASGFLGGSLGEFIKQDITRNGIHDYFVRIDGETRNCIAILHEGKQTEILEAGPTINEAEIHDFFAQFSECVQKARLITMSGSLPQGLPDDFYTQLIKIANRHDTPVLLDTKGELLKKTLQAKHKPFLIKPNEDELKDVSGVATIDEQTVIDTLNAPVFTGVPWVVVTRGAKGALIKTDDVLYKVTIPKVDAKNPVGSGDAVIAGFAAGLSRGMTGEALIRFGLSMGVLNAMEEKTGQINPDHLAWCQDEIRVEKR